jgi:hypothetical protein
VLTRKIVKAEMKARTPSQAGNLLSALRGMIRWMIDEGHLGDDDDLTISVCSGKAKASRESGGFVPRPDEDMARYRAKWPLGTEARLMFDILHYTFLRLGDAHRFGPLTCRRSCAGWQCKLPPRKAAATPPSLCRCTQACRRLEPRGSSGLKYSPAKLSAVGSHQ